MRKILLLFSIALFLVSCEGPMGPEGPEGPQGYGTNWKIITLVASGWTENLDPSGNNRFYSCHFNVPEINSTVYSEGSVISYLLIDNAATQQVLPYVQHYENTKGAMWTRTIDFDYSVGGVNVYVTNSDFAVDIPKPMSFRLVLMW